MRTIAQIARQLNLSERQFHRRLDSGDEEARDALRGEILTTDGGAIDTWLSSLVQDCEDCAEEFERCDPEFAEGCLALADRAREIQNSPAAIAIRGAQLRRLGLLPKRKPADQSEPTESDHEKA